MTGANPLDRDEVGPCDMCGVIAPLCDGLCGICELDEFDQMLADRDMGAQS